MKNVVKDEKNKRQFQNSSRVRMLNDLDPNPHICMVQSDRLVSKYLMSTWLQFVYVSNRTFSSNILLLEFSSEPLTLHSQKVS